MKKREALVITAYTGTLLCDFSDFQDFASEIIGRPIFTHEMAHEEISEEFSVDEDVFLSLLEQPKRQNEKTTAIKRNSIL